MRTIFCGILLTGLFFLGGFGAWAQTPSGALPSPKVVPAIDGILAAFQNHSLVFIGNHEGSDNHDLAQQEDFYAALVRDPRFARDVGNVVVEFGDAFDQNIIDRYVDGQDVPYTELRKVWTDTIGWAPPPIDLGYVNFFAQVRATNLTLPPSHRIHVWLGDAPVDWSKATKRDDIMPAGVDGMQYRDDFTTGLIEKQILSRARKALIIYGASHFLRDQVLLDTSSVHSSMGSRIALNYPGAIFSIYTYVGLFADKACALEFERDKANFTMPMLFTPVRGTTLDDPSFRRRCPPPGLWGAPPNATPEEKAEIAAHAAREVSGLNDDAMLYLGTAASLTSSPTMPDVYLDPDYLKELQRHWKIFGPNSATPENQGISVNHNPVSPQPFRR